MKGVGKEGKGEWREKDRDLLLYILSSVSNHGGRRKRNEAKKLKKKEAESS
jgi:hypothetical protein